MYGLIIYAPPQLLQELAWQDEQELPLDGAEKAGDSPADFMVLKRVKMRCAAIPHFGHLASIFSFIPFFISKTTPQAVHL
jgi:hypothetical protein